MRKRNENGKEVKERGMKKGRECKDNQGGGEKGKGKKGRE